MTQFCEFTGREICTITAALRLYQAVILGDPPSATGIPDFHEMMKEIAKPDGETPLSSREIDLLIQDDLGSIQ